MTALRDTHVIITGGSQGIGRAVATQVIDRGGRVSLIARGADALTRAVNELGDRAVCAPADVSDPAAVQTAVDHVCDKHGPCDVMITSAGYAQPGYCWDLPIESYRRQMEVDYLGTVHAVRAVLPSMIERHHGHLVLVSSTAGLIGVYGYSAYSPTKFAVRGLGETLRAELKPHGVSVSVVYPPDTDTPGFAKENESKPPETARISGAVRAKSAEVVAKAIVSGVERDRLTITIDPLTAVLARGAGVLGPAIRAMMDRDVRAEQESRR